MSADAPAPATGSRSRRSDGGFTLVELTVSIVIVGTLMGALALATVTILRTSPDNEARIDDARSTRGLSTQLSHDTTSTPPFLPETTQGGFDIDTSPTATNNDCGGDGTNVVHMQWRELTAPGTYETFVANYRFVVNGDEARIHRVTCSDSGSGFTNVSDLTLTPILDPSYVPTANIDRDPVTNEVTVLRFFLVGTRGEGVTIETSSRNPADSFS